MSMHNDFLNQELTRSFFEASDDCVKLLDLDGRLLSMNENGQCLMEIDDFGPLRGALWPTLWPEDARATLCSALDEARAGKVARFTADCPTAKGTLKSWGVIVAPAFDEEGRVVHVLSISRDLTRQQSFETQIERNTRFMHGLADVALELTREKDLNAVLASITRAARGLVGVHQAALSLTMDGTWRQAINSVSLSEKYEKWQNFSASTDGTGIYAMVCELNRPVRMTQAELESHPRWQAFGAYAAKHPPLRGWLAVPLISRDKRNLGVLQVSDKEDGSEFDSQDEAALTQLAHFASAAVEQSFSDMALRSSEARFRAAVDAVEGIVWTNDAAGRMVGEQPGWSRLTGQTEEEYRDFGWSAAVHPDDSAPTVEAWNAAVAAKQPFVFEHRVKTVAGEWRLFAIRAIPIMDQNGAIREWVGVHTDITTTRRQERELRLLNEQLEQRVHEALAERVRMESALRQAQKMEAIGKLTGGVAHDFNNLLQVISGNLQLLSKEAAGNQRITQRVQNALAGVSRGAKLASQLLAFGRRQALEPKVVNVSSFIRGMDDMLRRTLGEEIEIETVIAGGLWNTLIDPSQVENAILNLAINARDAMNGRGQLTIEASNAMLDSEYCRLHSDVKPGQYVLIAVTDTGTGIPPNVLERVFEPFFSTKPEGKGTGLGLSMVYGFVKQSGGHVKIYSEIGNGTTVKLYLPRSAEVEDTLVDTSRGPIKGGSETILVVEDDDDVREIAVSLLGELGYRVLTARDAASALTVIESGIPVDLLFTDVVMPGPLRSPELARKAKERLPNLAVLFTSGYTENSIVHGGRLDPGVELLGKPYTRETLARKIRHVLANCAQQSFARSQWQAQPPARHAEQVIQSTRLTVLLVEDDVLIRSCTREMLGELGHRVIEVGNAAEALKVMQATAIDVLMTDVNLPHVSGLELARQVRSYGKDIRVVFATGDQTAVRDAEKMGAALLIKPYDSTRLQQILMSVCSQAISTCVGHEQ